jgi:hypothetical protein
MRTIEVETRQSEVRESLKSKVRTPSDLGRESLTLQIRGKSYSYSFNEILEFLGRGICLDIQKTERPTSVQKIRLELELTKKRLAELESGKK